jgi:hypothetical protein
VFQVGEGICGEDFRSRYGGMPLPSFAALVFRAENGPQRRGVWGEQNARQAGCMLRCWSVRLGVSVEAGCLEVQRWVARSCGAYLEVLCPELRS